MPTEVEVEVQVSVLGSVGIRRDGTDVELGTRLRRLLAGLAVSNGSVVSTDRLVEIVWAGEPPEGAEKTLRSYMTRLRRALGSEDQRIVFREPGYVLELSTDELDSASFDDELDRALQHLRTADATTASGVLEGAIARWRGPAYAGFADEDWARPECVRLEERLVEAREALIEAKLADGLNQEAVAEALALVEFQPLRERPRSLLMRAMYANGRQAEALRVFGSYRRYLADETGLDPSEEIVALERRIARDDSSLAGGVRPLRGYELGERIGEGAFAVVHRAVQPGIERDVAIKIIRAELADRPDFIRRFELEARTVARIEHPNVVPLFDYWREPGAAYLVMRLLQGGSVEQALRSRGPYSREQTVRLLDDIGGALETAHRAGVVHRDVRPANLLLDSEGTTYLADFGIALPAAAIDDLPIGSPAYAAPEVLRGEPASASADVLSLGVTTFEVLTGRLPFADSADRGDLIRRQLSDPLPPVRATRTDLPAAVDDILARATAKAPGDRYATVASFVDDLRAALDLPAPAAHKTQVAWRGPVHNPYVGLNAFDEEDADKFFGREKLVAELVDALEQRRMVTVVGPSGSGKSSVVKAGVLPALRRGAIPGSENWFVATMVPGTDPVDALETALLRVAVNPPATLREQLVEQGGLLRAIRRVLPDERTRILLVIDQFEELFTQARDPDERDRFLVELADATTHPESPLRVIATLRADHYDAPLRHASIAELVTHGTVTVRPMTPDELERAISLPAASVGVDVEPALATDLVAGISARPTALPLLQFALTELFDRRVANTMLLSSHRELGGLTGALAARADRILEAGGPDDESEMRRIFGRLVTFGEGSDDTRRRALQSEFGDRERTAWLLDAYVTARLLTTDRDPTTREPTVEVAHEALLREWPRAVAWLNEDRELRRTVGSIGVAATAWDRGGRQASDLYRGGRLESGLDVAETNVDWLSPVDHQFLDASRAQAEADRTLERRRIRRLRVLLAGVGFLLAVALVAGGLATRQQRRAERQTEVAVAAVEDANLATLISRSAAQSAENPELAVLLALEAHRRSPGPQTEQAVLNALGSSSIPNRIATFPGLDAGDCPTPTFLSADGLWEYAVVDGRLVRLDLTTGNVADYGPAPQACGVWVGDPASNRVVVSGTEADPIWVGSFDDPYAVELEQDRPVYLLDSDPATGAVVFVDPQDGDETVALFDVATGEQIGSSIGEGGFWSVEVDPSGSFAAVSHEEFDTADRGRLRVLNVQTGDELFRIDTTAPATSLTFDPDRLKLIAGMSDGELITVDLVTGEVVATVTTSATSPVIEVGVRGDGQIVAVTEGQIEVVDRRTGPTGLVIELRDVELARVRPDGTVVTRTADKTFDVIDLTGNALVERSWPVDPFARVAFNAGGAAVFNQERQAVSVVDLATGEQSEIVLRDPEGNQLVVDAVYPEPDGVWAVAARGVIARFEGDTQVEQIDFPGRLFTGTRFEDVIANLGPDADGEMVASLTSLEHSSAGILFTVPAPDGSSVHPALGGGLHVFDRDGTLHTYDADGELTGEVDTGAQETFINTMDPTTGVLAVAGVPGAVVVIDPSNGSVDQLPGNDTVANLGFARDGKLLVITGFDGTVRIWDLERDESAGLAWDGTGAVPSSPSWYDASSNSIWVYTSGQLLEIPLDPQRWVERACEVVGRDLTLDEWNRFVPWSDDTTPGLDEQSGANATHSACT